MADALSEKQQAILEFLETFIAEHDYPPSIRDIQTGCGISSTSVVDYNLKRLEERGHIRRDREVSAPSSSSTARAPAAAAPSRCRCSARSRPASPSPRTRTRRRRWT
jgi:SOS-response transcriptional repressor LexA